MYEILIYIGIFLYLYIFKNKATYLKSTFLILIYLVLSIFISKGTQKQKKISSLLNIIAKEKKLQYFSVFYEKLRTSTEHENKTFSAVPTLA